MSESHNQHCIEWKGKSRYFYGYGCTSVPGSRRAHRWAWEKFYGAIPAGMMVCHRCDNPPCINPLHLFLGTQRDNQRDASAKGRNAQQKKTHCAAGHEYSGANLISIYYRGWNRRDCRTCSILRKRKYNARLRAIRALPYPGIAKAEEPGAKRAQEGEADA